MFTTTAAANPLKLRKFGSRRLIIIDIENVIGEAVHTQEQVEWARTLITNALELRGDEQIVIGTSHFGAIEVHLGWKGPRLVVRSGIDGADKALIDVLSSENVSDRFTEVVVVSGDHLFAEPVSRLAGNGVHVTVLSHAESLSKRLQFAAGAVVTFTKDAVALGGAA